MFLPAEKPSLEEDFPVRGKFFSATLSREDTLFPPEVKNFYKKHSSYSRHQGGFRERLFRDVHRCTGQEGLDGTVQSTHAARLRSTEYGPKAPPSRERGEAASVVTATPLCTLLTVRGPAAQPQGGAWAV